MNKVILVGRLATDIEMKKANDKKYGKLTLAVNRVMKKDEADFIQCTVFGKTAETMFEYCRKGHRIGIEGRLQISQYEKNGEKRTGYSIIVEGMEFLQTKNEKSKDIKTGVDAKEIKTDTSKDFQDEEFPF